jgi:DNA-directed RNA polymerase subunit RPC12/RpoP
MRNYHMSRARQATAGPAAFQCGECNYATHRHLNLKRHMDVTHYGKGYQCEQCDRIFTESGSLKRHILSIHEEIRYPCDECGYRATEKGSLRRHKAGCSVSGFENYAENILQLIKRLFIFFTFYSSGSSWIWIILPDLIPPLFDNGSPDSDLSKCRNVAHKNESIVLMSFYGL